VYIGLGGSSTNDGGAGLLVGLGARLVNRAQMSLPPTPECLEDAHEMDVSGLPSALYETQLILLSDVNNPLCGPRGATAIFGPQKGVTPDLQARYDHALARFADVLEAALGADGGAKGSVASSTSAATPASFSGNTAPRISSNVVTNTTSGTAENKAPIAPAPWRERPGAGAAGGLGYALQCLGAEFRSGAEVVADLVGLDAALNGADWLITGEGRSDAQTLMGKTPHAAARRANARGVPVSLVSGGIDLAALPALGEVFTGGCHALAFGPMALAEAIGQTPALLPARAEQLARLVQSASARRSG
jgi:glycerate 2-kinase